MTEFKFLNCPFKTLLVCIVLVALFPLHSFSNLLCSSQVKDE